MSLHGVTNLGTFDPCCSKLEAPVKVKIDVFVVVQVQ